MERRIITTEVTAEDERIETTLRPQCLRDYVGQEKIKSCLLYTSDIHAVQAMLGHSDSTTTHMYAAYSGNTVGETYRAALPRK